MGTLNIAQRHHLREVVRGNVVWDLGAGSGDLAFEIKCLGASKVYAVDKNLPDDPPEFVEWIHCEFVDVDSYMIESGDIAFVSWPINRPTKLHAILGLFSKVVYLGSNFDGLQCGYLEMWEHLAARELISVHLSRENSMLVYGDICEPRKLVCYEEHAGIMACVDHDEYPRYDREIPTDSMFDNPLLSKNKR